MGRGAASPGAEGPDYTEKEMGRALLPGIAAALGFGLALGHLAPLGGKALGAAALAFLGAAWRRSVPLLWVSALFLGLALVRPTPLPKHLAFQLPLLQECTGTVVDLPEPTAKRLSFTVAVEGLGVRLLAYGPQGLPIRPGQRVRLFGEYGEPEPEGYREYLARRGIHGLFWAERVEILAEGPKGLFFWAAVAREEIRELLAPLPARARALLSALLLGSRGLLAPEEKEAFREAGVAHLLALSGLHVGILVAGGWGLLGLLRVPKTWRYPLLLPLVAAYVLLGGMRVSLLRAALMFGVLGVFWLLWGRGWVARAWFDPLQSLAFAALLVLLLWPWSALDAAFQLSFAATAGILLLWPSWARSPRRARLPRLPRYGADLLAVSVCAQLGVLPFLGATFGYLTPYGLLANLVLIPWTTLLLWLGILGLPLLLFPPTRPAAVLVLHAAAEPYLRTVEALSRLPGAALPVGENFGLWCLFALWAFLLLRAAQEEGPGLAGPPRGPHRAWPG